MNAGWPNSLKKKDLILTRISKYDDNPSLIYTWKLTSKNFVEELGVTPMEELDMLIRYLGVESSRQALVLGNAMPTTQQLHFD